MRETKSSGIRVRSRYAFSDCLDRLSRSSTAVSTLNPRFDTWIQLLARTEILTAVSKAPEELEERSPLARIVYERCVLHRGHHLEQLRKWVA